MATFSRDKIVPASDRESASLIERAAERLDQEARPGSGTTAPLTDSEPSRPSGVNGRAATSLSPPGGQRGEIDLEALRRAGYVSPDHLRTPIAEEIRMIKRSVVSVFHHRQTERSNLVMVTSSYPQEGKTFVGMNLALSLACEVDYHVLLVDADVERPSVFDRFGLEPQVGLMDWLKAPESLDVADIIQRTNIERLSLIGPGSRDDRSTELLASQRMGNLTTELATRYPDRLIIFDSPPLLSCSEPTSLAEHMGQIVFVVEADTTKRTTIDRALALLPEDCWTGLVLNKSRSRMADTYYGEYGYKSEPAASDAAERR